MKKFRLITVLMILASITFSAQTGYIYVHKKAISEVSSGNFAFNLTGASNVAFSLNDSPDALNAFDLGNSHGPGEGQLWAIINNAANPESTHVTNGTLYTRTVGSSQWAAVAQPGNTVRSVDGISANTAVYCNAAGNVAIYNGTTSTIIWTPAAHGGTTIVDVASGGPGGVIVAVGNNGTLYRYSGTVNSWTAYSGTNVSNVYRVDVNPTNQQVVFIRTGGAANQGAYRLDGGNTSAGAIRIPPPSGVTATANAIRDVAVTNSGTVLTNFKNGTTTTSSDVIYENTGSTSAGWTRNDTSRSLSGITAGVGEQKWAINTINPDIAKHSIFSSSSSGLWLDDERVRTSVANGNSIMIPVTPGTYTLTETVNAGWYNSEISIYDPTNNSSSSITTSTATINVAADEVVNVVYLNTLQNSVAVPVSCAENPIVTFGSGAAVYGPAFQGFTAYHYLNGGRVSDGYYSLVKNSSQWYPGQNLTLQNHTPGETNGYFGIFNAAYSTDDFFRQTVTNLSVGTTYEFAFWVADLSPANPIRPNVTMGISFAGGTPVTFDTGNITSTVWTQYIFNFTATDTTAEIFLRNNSVGGYGNDLAIDDISFRPAPPVVPQSTVVGDATLLCSNPGSSYQLENSLSGGTWSTTTPTLVTVSSTGLVTTITGAVGTANINYSYTSTSGCTTVQTLSIAVGACVCYNDPATGTGPDAMHGITLLKRAGADSGGWPMVRKSAHTVLESNTKGLVITRMTTAQVTAISSPQEGMMVYDTNAQCLKLYDGTAWSCFNVAGCP